MDTLILNDAIFAALGIKGAPEGMFAEGEQALDAQTRLIYSSTTGALYYDPDGVGGQAQVKFAQLGATIFPTLDEWDLMVV
jgi:Ca2+-binding RTX toxin-like protein